MVTFDIRDDIISSGYSGRKINIAKVSLQGPTGDLQSWQRRRWRGNLLYSRVAKSAKWKTSRAHVDRTHANLVERRTLTIPSHPLSASQSTEIIITVITSKPTDHRAPRTEKRKGASAGGKLTCFQQSNLWLKCRTTPHNTRATGSGGATAVHWKRHCPIVLKTKVQSTAVSVVENHYTFQHLLKSISYISYLINLWYEKPPP